MREHKTYPLDPARKQDLVRGFVEAFGTEPQRFFSAPGRTEIGGNHTDHQRGHVLAASVDLDTIAAVRASGTNTIRLLSQGYPLCTIDLSDLAVRAEEANTTAALIRGVAARFRALGCSLQGFDAYVTSTVLPGSGLSSSAAFEVLVGTILNGLFFDWKLTAPQVAAVGQYAENVYFGKPCGLMDQTASAVGGLVAMDFEEANKPVIRQVDFDFSACGHALCIVDSRASHADLTGEYAAVPQEMKAVAACFDAEVLSEITETAFFSAIPRLRGKLTDRAILRAMHFYHEEKRVQRQVEALEAGDFAQFLTLVKKSGHSSFMYLQNITPAGSVHTQDMALTLALCDHYLAGRGAYRVHGGGFAGTVQAFVPLDRLASFRSGIDDTLGKGACHVLTIRPYGGVEAE